MEAKHEGIRDESTINRDSSERATDGDGPRRVTRPEMHMLVKTGIKAGPTTGEETIRW